MREEGLQVEDIEVGEEHKEVLGSSIKASKKSKHCSDRQEDLRAYH